ncbi:dnaJ homolog subfamily B member 12 [Eurosta solidaginis]|uniref:dnaJ homolog subfamily B member 12 n=1 Tax=Eurosta solidaginis TaxID=178769 RepID=UPI003530C0F9
MDGNKDEAQRCIDIAVQAFAEGKIEKAEKFLLKAEKLFPTERAKELLSKVKTGTGGAKPTMGARANGTTNRDSAANNDGPRKRKNSDSRNSEPEYTKEQIEAVRKVKSCRDYYEILSVKKEATDSEIKKSYKKLALLLHPDKNKAPGASDAFKAVGNAAAILTDVEKRKQYDLYGLNESHAHNHGVRRDHNEYAYARGFQAEVSPEDLFNMFFGGGFNQQNVYMRQQRRRQQHRDDGENQSNSSALINFLPILLLIGLSMISSFFISDPIYSLSQSPKYAVKRETNRLKVPYYVKNNFHTEYQGSVGRLEESVEEDFIDHLKYSCSRERNYRDSMLAKARSFGDRELFNKAQKINTPSCDNLNNYLNK